MLCVCGWQSLHKICINGCDCYLARGEWRQETILPSNDKDGNASWSTEKCAAEPKKHKSATPWQQRWAWDSQMALAWVISTSDELQNMKLECLLRTAGQMKGIPFCLYAVLEMMLNSFVMKVNINRLRTASIRWPWTEINSTEEPESFVLCVRLLCGRLFEFYYFNFESFLFINPGGDGKHEICAHRTMGRWKRRCPSTHHAMSYECWVASYNFLRVLWNRMKRQSRIACTTVRWYGFSSISEGNKGTH